MEYEWSRWLIRSANLWAITSYFNPVGYHRRLENYRTFHRRLKVPLVTVELSFDGRFQLSTGDADILVQLRSTSILWQKERLLNLALKSLPDSCDKVAWLDCDILFEDDGWVERANRALDEVALLHLFQERNDLSRDFTSGNPGSWTSILKAQSVLYQLAIGETTAQGLCAPKQPWKGSTAGLAWAGRRDILEEHGFYDACIVGAGDKAMLAAALGVFDAFTRSRPMNPRRIEHYVAWAKPYFNRVRGRVGHIPGVVFHLWHGDLAHRGIVERHQQFEQFDFDPYKDIALDGNGCWRWNSEKPEMQEFVRQYFASRKEDGM